MLRRRVNSATLKPDDKLSSKVWGSAAVHRRRPDNTVTIIMGAP
jgi:hypothetical protein